MPATLKNNFMTSLLIVWGMLLSACSAVNKLGLQSPADAVISFEGLGSLRLTPDGGYLLVWDPVAGVADPSLVGYEVYMATLPSLPAGLALNNDPGQTATTANADGVLVHTKAAQMDAPLSPIGLGQLLTTVQGGRSFKLSTPPSETAISAFQVRAVLADGRKDANRRVLIFNPSGDILPFDGISSLNVTPTGSVLLSWSSLSQDSGIDQTKVKYSIYVTARQDSLEDVMAGTTAVQPQTSSMDAKKVGIGSLVTLDESKLPSATQSPIAIQVGGNFYQLEKNLDPSLVYIFEVRATGPAGQTDINHRVLVYQKPQLSFSGLMPSGADLASDYKFINLTWSPATGAQGSALYTIFGDAGFSNVIGTTTATSYTIGNIQRGRSYAFGVRASDSSGSEFNTRYVVVNVPLPNFNGCTSSQALNNSQIQVAFDLPPAVEQVQISRDGTQIYTATPGSASTYVDSGLTAGTTYNYRCVATVAGKSLNGATTTATTAGSRTPPVFAGLVSAKGMTDTKISLSWSASPSSDLQQYNIYLASNLNNRIGSSTTTSYVAAGLLPGATYSFVVRAMNSSSYEDNNTVQKSATTLNYAVPDFSGLTSVSSTTGVAGLTSLILNWTPAGGNVTGYRVYISPTSGGENFASPAANVTGVTASGTVFNAAGPYLAGQYLTGATITGLNPNTAYYVIVRAFYFDGTNVLTDINQVEKTGQTTNTVAPTFNGAQAAVQGSGLLALTSATVSWNTPQTNGVWDGFQVAYEEGTCAAGFSSSPAILIASGANTLSYTVTGLTGNKTYRFRVRSHYPPTSLRDSNTACVEATTTALPPNFAGVTGVATASGISGFTQVNATWSQASGSFSYYLVEWDTNATFSAPTALGRINDMSTTSAQITGLLAKRQIYVRVTAVFDGITPNLSAGQTTVRSAITSPDAPIGEAVTSVSVASATALSVTWSAPTNSGLYSGYKLWRSCAATAMSDINLAVNGSPLQTFNASTLNYTDTGRTSNTPCCYQVRAYYSDGTNTLDSLSNTPPQCATPQLLAPAFAGVQSLSTPTSAAGFGQINVSWNAVAAGDYANFSYYEVAWATTSSGHSWGLASNLQISTPTTTSTTISGLDPNTTYYVRVRAVNAGATPFAANGATAVLSATTTPKAPTGDNLSAVAASNASSVLLTYTPPNSQANGGGLFSDVFLFLYQGSATQLTNYQQTVVSPANVANPSFAATMSGTDVTLASPPTTGALIRVPLSVLNLSGANSLIIRGLTTNQPVCIMAMAVNWVSGNASQFLRSDTPSSRCATPSAVAPAFAGISTVSTPVSLSGFSQLAVTWAPIAAADFANFSYYQISWATSPNPASWNTRQVNNATTSSANITGLTDNTTYYVKVTAVNANGSTPVANGDAVVKSTVTTPMAPTGDSFTAVSPSGATGVTLTYTAPSATPSVGGLYNNMFVFIYQGTAAQVTSYAQNAILPANISSPSFAATVTSGPVSLSAVPTSGALIRVPASSLTAGASNTVTINGLTSNQPVCVTTLTVYWASNSASQFLQGPLATPKCTTPAVVAPTFAGVSSVAAPISASGFNQLVANWTPIAVGDQGNFSYYEIDWATSASPATWNSTQVSSATASSATISGLNANTTYYVRVLAVNNQGSSPVSNGSGQVLSAITTPKAPTGDSLSAAASAGSNSVSLTYTTPSLTPASGGLYNYLFFWIYQGSTSNVASYQANMGTPALANITAVLGSGAATLAAAPTSGALIQVPASAYIGGASNSFVINGLNANQQVCIRAAAVYWVNNQASQYLISQTPTTQCATPTATAPTFAGVSSLTGVGDNHDFSQIVVNWGTITGSCTSVDVSVSTSAGAPDFTTATFPSAKGLSCSQSSYTVTGLSPGTTYYVQVRANNSSCGITSNCYSGTGTELNRVTLPPIPTGDGADSVIFTAVPKAPDTATLTYSLPTGGGPWTQISIWRATGATQAAAISAVRAAAATKSDNTGPTGAPVGQVLASSPQSATATSYTDTDPTIVGGTIYCYLVKAVYNSGGYYNASTNTTTQCGSSNYTQMGFSGVATLGSSVGSGCSGTGTDASYAGGTNFIQLNLASAPTGNVEEYWVYYSNSPNLNSFDLTAPPWQIVDNTTANSFNPTVNSTTIYVGCKGRTFSGPGYFIVRGKNYSSADRDTNTVVSNLVNIPSNAAHYVYVAPSISRLSYPYWIGRLESTRSSGRFGSDSVTNSETNLATCNYQFHVNHVPFHSSCGTNASTTPVYPRYGTSPATTNWHQAWAACRNTSVPGTIGSTGASSSDGNVYVRLPTEDEWRRASRFDPSNYANMWLAYSSAYPNCVTTSGILVATGTRANCVSLVGAMDMAGNLREWVDQRMTMYDVSANSESRFSYGPQIGRLLANGIATQANAANSPITRRYHNITPAANGLGLLLGSDYQLPTPVTITGTTTNGSGTITTSSTTGLALGQAVNGTNIPNGAIITAITTNANFVISSPATATGSGTFANLYQKQYDAETAMWQDPTTTPATAGFRCVAWPNTKLMPTMAQLAQTSEPTFTIGDIPGSPTPTAAQAAQWKIPENLYVKDARPESVSHLLTYFPNTTNLAVWPFNQSSGGDQADVSGNGKTLTLTASTAMYSGTGIDGNTYVNTLNPSKSQTLSSSDSLFNATGAFTTGFWINSESWLNWTLFLTNPNFMIYTYSGRLVVASNIWNYGYLSYNYNQLSSGWHHVVFVRSSSTSHSLYIDGIQVASSDSTWTMNNSGTFTVNASNSGNNYTYSLANTFFHAGIGYTTKQVQRLYYGTMSNNASTGPYASTANSAGTNDGINISWKPWTKQYCTGSCSSSADTGFTYYIYRYVEPTRSDIRTTTPWALKHGPYATLPAALTGANATAMPMDPLATDSAGNLLCSNSYATTPMCTLVASISGSACNSGSPSGCSFTDSSAWGNGFSNNAIYNYIMVVGDAEGNYNVPKIQRYRSPYFAGDFSQGASASFRTEQRWRRASVMLTDEAMQQNAPLQANSQIMTYVPMDTSGLDHDYFIYKYRAGRYWGNITNNSPSGAYYPLQASSGAWVSNAASCTDVMLRNGIFDLTACGDGTTVNTSTAVLESKQGDSPISADPGAAWKACRSSGIVDGSGNTYYPHLVTDPEWIKATDFGDVAQSGTITQSAIPNNIGASVQSLTNNFFFLSLSSTIGSSTFSAVSTTGVQVGQFFAGGNGITNTYVTSFVENTSITTTGTGSSTGAFTGYSFPIGACIYGAPGFGAAPGVNGTYLTANCRSRYGVDSVGSLVTSSQFAGTSGNLGFDNGIDGLSLGQSITGSSAAYTNSYDLLRGFPTSTTSAAVNSNNTKYYPDTTRAIEIYLRTGQAGTTGNSSNNGRWNLGASAPTGTGAIHCVLAPR